MPSNGHGFSYMGDMSHALVILILIHRIHVQKSVAGISFKTQLLYAIAVVARTLYIFKLVDFIKWSNNQNEVIDLVYKSVFILFLMISSLYILYLIRFPFRQTYEKQLDTFRLLYAIPIVSIATIVYSDNDLMYLIRYGYSFNFMYFVYSIVEFLERWSFNIEAMAVLPQLVLLRKSVTTDLTAQYIVALQGAYRGLYIINSIYLYFVRLNFFPIFNFHNLIESSSNIIQTIFAAITIQKIFLRHINTEITTFIVPVLSSKMTSCVLFILRYIQLSASAVSIYVFSYLIWAHVFHYCAFYGSPYCTETEMGFTKVPWTYIFVIAACVIAVLENFISSIVAIHNDHKFNFRRLFFSTGPISLLYFTGIGLASEIPSHRPCWVVDETINVKTSVVQRFCTLRTGGLVLGDIASVCTAQIALIALITMVYQVAQEKRFRKTTPSPVDINVKEGTGKLVEV